MSFQERLKTIVVAEDLEGQPKAALEYARKLAGAYKSRVILAHGVDPIEYAAVGAIPRRVMEHIGSGARSALNSMVADLVEEGIPSHSELRQGEVAQMLVDVARQYSAGLIVIGTRGREGAGPVAVGAVAEQVVRTAHCAVLAISEDWNAGEFRPIPGGPVLLAVDRNEATFAAVDAACSLAETFHRTLLVLHARRPAEAVASLNPAATTLKQFSIHPDGRFPVRCIVKDGSPADAIDAMIEQHRPSILVVGVKRASATPGPHGTAYALLARSHVPVLCVPAESA